MRSKLVLGLVLSILALPLAATAQPPFDGDQVRLDTGEQGRPHSLAVSFGEKGGMLAAWASPAVGIAGRTFTPDGRPTGDDVVLVADDAIDSIPFSGTVRYRRDPVTVPVPSRGVLLFWTEAEYDLRVDYFFRDRKLRSREVIGQLFALSGAPVGEPFSLSGELAGLHAHPRAVRLPGGDTVVVWDRQLGGEAGGILAQRVSDAGELLGTPFRVDGEGGGGAWPDLLALPGRELLVAWEGCCDGGGDRGVFARLLEADGTPAAPVVALNDATAGDQRVPRLGGDGQGGLVAVWQGPFDDGETGVVRIFARPLTARGAIAGAEQLISAGGYGEDHSAPVVSAAPGGDLLVAWFAWEGAFRVGVYGTRLDAAAAPLAEPFRISQTIPGARRDIVATPAPGGGHLVAWAGYDEAGELGILARRLVPRRATGQFLCVPLSEPLASPFAAGLGLCTD